MGPAALAIMLDRHRSNGPIGLEDSSLIAAEPCTLAWQLAHKGAVANASSTTRRVAASVGRTWSEGGGVVGSPGDVGFLGELESPGEFGGAGDVGSPFESSSVSLAQLAL